MDETIQSTFRFLKDLRHQVEELWPDNAADRNISAVYAPDLDVAQFTKELEKHEIYGREMKTVDDIHRAYQSHPELMHLFHGVVVEKAVEGDDEVDDTWIPASFYGVDTMDWNPQNEGGLEMENNANRENEVVVDQPPAPKKESAPKKKSRPLTGNVKKQKKSNPFLGFGKPKKRRKRRTAAPPKSVWVRKK